MTNSALPNSEFASHQSFAIACLSPERADCRLAIANWNSAVSKSAAGLQLATSCLCRGANCRFAGLERCASYLSLAAESLAYRLVDVGEERRGEEFCGLSSHWLLPGAFFKVCGTMICWRGDGPHSFLEHFFIILKACRTRSVGGRRGQSCNQSCKPSQTRKTLSP